MTAMEQSHGGGIAALGIVTAGVLVLALVVAANGLTARLDVQPLPEQPTVAMPPPMIQAGIPTVLALGLGTVMLADTLVIPEGAVETGAHAGERHGAEADEVRAAVTAAIIANPILGQQPPCKDGRHRFVVPMGKAWGVWVLEQVGERLYKEITAFKTSNQDYVRSVRDDCGNGNSSWWGHSYAQ